MVPDQEDPVEPSTILWNEMARQTPGGGLRSPATRSLSSPTPASADAPGAVAETEAREAAVASRWQRLRESVWSPVLFKAAGACLGLSSLALVGAASMQDVPGVPVTASGTDWLAGEADAKEGKPPLPEAMAASTTKGAPPASSPARVSATTHESEKGSAKGAKADGSGAASPCVSEEAPAPAPQGVTADGKIVLNRATATELTRLPGVGQRRAEQIVALRERLGRFRRVTDLLRVKGIGPKSLRRLTPLVVLDPPEPDPDS